MLDRATNVGKLPADKFEIPSFSQTMAFWTRCASVSSLGIRCCLGGGAVVNCSVGPVLTFLLGLTDDGSAWLARQLVPPGAL